MSIDLAIIPGLASCVGVVYAIMRNGRRGKKQDDELKMQLKMEVSSITKALGNPDTGLGAIKKCVDEQRLHCTEVSTRIEGQVSTNAKEIIKLRMKEK